MKFLIFAFLFLAGCASSQNPLDPVVDVITQPEVKPGQPTPTPGPAITFKGDWNKPEWDKAMSQQIRDSKLDQTIRISDAAYFCPQFSALTQNQKEVFFLTAFVAMAKRESSYNSDSATYECRKSKGSYSNEFYSAERGQYCMKGNPNIEGGYIVSRGVYQMSQESASYAPYGCGKMTKELLHDPIKNIQCMVKALTYYVNMDKYFGDSVENGVDANGKTKWLHKGAARYWAVFRDSTSTNAESRAYIKSKTRALAFCK